MAKVDATKVDADSPDWIFYCPGCKQHHGVWTTKPVIVDGEPNIWKFNNDIDSPTFTPSIHITIQRTGSDKKETKCHSFVTDGRIQFLGDCRHKLKGQTIELPEIE